MNGVGRVLDAGDVALAASLARYLRVMINRDPRDRASEDREVLCRTIRFLSGLGAIPDQSAGTEFDDQDD